jgi:hypothetical protein
MTVTFTLDEAPVQVPRRVVLSLPGDAPADEALLAEVALQALLAGPTEEERAEGITSFFSEETAGLLAAVEMTGDSVMVDFHDLAPVIPNASSSAGSFFFLSELAGTLFALPGIRVVEYRMEGSCEAFWNFLQRDCQAVERPTES